MQGIKKIIKNNIKLYNFFMQLYQLKEVLFHLPKIPWYLKCFKEYKRMCKSNPDNNLIRKIVFSPVLSDYGKENCEIGQYTFQDLWAAKKIAVLSQDHEHYDIGSRVDGFITHLLSFRGKVTLIDIRPMSIHIDNNLNFLNADATNLEQISDNSIYSISSLCALEHFGLGRYGDPINPMACFDAFRSIQRVVLPGGNIYLSIPVGEERIEFNGQRIFNPNTIIRFFEDSVLLEFSIATSRELKLNENINYEYICEMERNYRGILFGLFHFQKK